MNFQFKSIFVDIHRRLGWICACKFHIGRESRQRQVVLSLDHEIAAFVQELMDNDELDGYKLIAVKRHKYGIHGNEPGLNCRRRQIRSTINGRRVCRINVPNRRRYYPTLRRIFLRCSTCIHDDPWKLHTVRRHTLMSGCDRWSWERRRRAENTWLITFGIVIIMYVFHPSTNDRLRWSGWGAILRRSWISRWRWSRWLCNRSLRMWCRLMAWNLKLWAYASEQSANS